MLLRSLLRRLLATAPIAPPAAAPPNAPVAAPSPMSSDGGWVYAFPPAVLLLSDIAGPAAPGAPRLPLPNVVEGFLCADEVVPHPL